jgi:hypothetical protein
MKRKHHRFVSRREKRRVARSGWTPRKLAHFRKRAWAWYEARDVKLVNMLDRNAVAMTFPNGSTFTVGPPHPDRLMSTETNFIYPRAK